MTGIFYNTFFSAKKACGICYKHGEFGINVILLWSAWFGHLALQ